MDKRNVYSEEFLIPFYNMLEKFVKEYDNMEEMDIIKKASELLTLINNK